MKEWAQLRVSGFLGLIHKLMMFITWPFRHWKFMLLALVLLIIAMVVIPLVYDVKFSDIPSWYKAKMTHPFMTVIKNNVQDLKLATEQKITQSVDTVKNQMQKIVPEIKTAESAKEEPKEKIRFTAWNVAKFNKAKYQKPQPQNTTVEPQTQTFAELKKATPNRDESEETKEDAAVQTAPEESYYEGELEDYYAVRRDLDLMYLTQSEKLYGHVDVVGPNSLYIENTFIYLYGIYTNPDIYNEQSAQLYLEKLIDNQPVHCDIVAYSIQSQTPTALCFLNGRLINQELVDADYAADIALK